MLSESMKRIRLQHRKEMVMALDDLQETYEKKRQEAFSKLVRFVDIEIIW